MNKHATAETVWLFVPSQSAQMVQAERGQWPGARGARAQWQARALVAVAGVAVLCAVAVIATRSPTANLVDRPQELMMDSMTVAGKIVRAQKYKKANEAERKRVVKSILGGNHEHSSGKKIVSKVASIVANNHLSYHQRMEAMKKLLNAQTDTLKQKPLHRTDEPSHAHGKVEHRGRWSGHKSAAQIAQDNKKAMAEGAKLIAQTAAKKAGNHEHTLRSALGHKHKGAAQTSDDNRRAIKAGEKLMQEERHKKHNMRHTLHMSAKDEAIKKVSEHTAANPTAENKIMHAQVEASAKAKAIVKKLAGDKAAALKKPESKKALGHKAEAKPESAESKSQKLIKWAEKHGLPKKLAENPADKQKVKDIIARMKADLVVERIKKEFQHDDQSVGHIIKSADPSAATTGF